MIIYRNFRYALIESQVFFWKNSISHRILLIFTRYYDVDNKMVHSCLRFDVQMMNLLASGHKNSLQDVGPVKFASYIRMIL